MDVSRYAQLEVFGDIDIGDNFEMLMLHWIAALFSFLIENVFHKIFNNNILYVSIRAYRFILNG